MFAFGILIATKTDDFASFIRINRVCSVGDLQVVLFTPPSRNLRPHLGNHLSSGTLRAPFPDDKQVALLP